MESNLSNKILMLLTELQIPTEEKLNLRNIPSTPQTSFNLCC